MSGSNRHSNWSVVGLCSFAGVLWAAIVLIAGATGVARSCPEMQILYQLRVSGVLFQLLVLVNGDVFREPSQVIWGIFTFQVLVVVLIAFLVLDSGAVDLLCSVYGVNISVALVSVAAGIMLVNGRKA